MSLVDKLVRERICCKKGPCAIKPVADYRGGNTWAPSNLMNSIRVKKKIVYKYGSNHLLRRGVYWIKSDIALGYKSSGGSNIVRFRTCDRKNPRRDP